MIRRDDLRHLRVILGRFVRPYLGLIVLASLLGLIVAALNTLQPLVLAPIVDAATSGSPAAARSWRAITLNNVGATVLAWTGLERGSWRVVVTVALVYIALVGVTSGIGFLPLLLVSRVRAQLFRDFQETGYRHLLGLDMSYFVQQRRCDDLGTRLNNDALKAAQTVEPVIRGFIQSGAQLALSAVLLVRTDGLLTIGVLVAFLVHLAITRLLRDRIRRLVGEQSRMLADLASRIHETVLSIRIVKSFGAESFELTRFVNYARRFARVMVKDGAYKNLETPLRDIADAIGLMVVVLMAFSAFTQGRLSISGFVLFVALTRRALTPAAQLGEAVLLLQTALGSAERLLDLLNEKPATRDGFREADSLHDAIRLEHVGFAYRGHAPVLHDVSLEIRRGEIVALVGRSGAGKSTLADLILRLYDPVEGRITWDGVPIQEFTQESYRRRFGVVSQEALIFNATVAENIAYGRPIDQPAVTRASRTVHAEEFVQALPLGYDAVVGDRGIRLSGGQRQRLAIARALYGRPEVLVLDEATSSLDAISEAAVQEAIVENLTVLVIAHRLSTVRRADRIAVLDAGRIEAVGTHTELFATSPLYERLCRHQLHGAPEAPL